MRLSILAKGWAAEIAICLIMQAGAAYGQSAPPPQPVPPPAPTLPPVGLGTVSFLDAVGGPGTLVQWNSTAYVANRVNDANGRRAPVDFRTDAEAVLLHVAHTTKTRLLGAFVGGEILVPIAHVRVRPGPVGESATGFGDVIVGGYLQWSGKKLLGKPFAARLDLDVVAPTGDYSRGRLVNLGSKAWTFSPYLALTWEPAPRWEISNRTNFNWTSKSTKPPFATGASSWQAGAQLAINLSTSYELSKAWRVGIGGYTLQQLTASRIDGAPIRGGRQQVWGLGPGMRWSHANKMVIVNAYKEFGAQSRPQGYQGVLRFLTIF